MWKLGKYASYGECQYSFFCAAKWDADERKKGQLTYFFSTPSSYSNIRHKKRISNPIEKKARYTEREKGEMCDLNGIVLHFRFVIFCHKIHHKDATLPSLS